jgi:uncharacterized membrane protein YphA (DoxX/SURF4 family)/thiol-disulfide isomerase/thioredoxin
MHAAVLLARAVLALVFLIAGVAKLADLDASRDTVEAFGFTLPVARVVGTVLPFSEITVGLGLLIQESSRWAAVAAIVLLAGFTAAVGRALAQGNRPDCNCFGQLTSQAVGAPTIARNVVFLLIGALVVWRAPGDSLSGWTSGLAAANLVAGLAVLVAALASAAAVHFHRRAAAERLASLRSEADAAADSGPHAPLPGEAAPLFSATDLAGSEVSLVSLCARGLPVVLVFASPMCGPCGRLLPQLARWSSTLRGRIVIAVVESLVPNPEVLRAQLEVREELVLLSEQGLAIAAAYAVAHTPTAFVVGSDGAIEAGAQSGAGAIERLVRSTLRRHPDALAGVA